MFDGVELNETQCTLLEAKALISDPERWCQGYYGKDENGNFCDADSGDAVAVCALGSLIKVTGSEGEAEDFLTIAAEYYNHENAVELNDSADHATVMACFDKAIELAGEGR